MTLGSILIIAEAPLLALLILVFVQNRRWQQRWQRFFADGDVAKLEEFMTKYLSKAEANEAKFGEIFQRLDLLNLNLKLAQQKISIVRFNPFGDTGGDQSFAIAVLDGHDSGYVLTSIHGRQGTRVYVKPIDF